MAVLSCNSWSQAGLVLHQYKNTCIINGTPKAAKSHCVVPHPIQLREQTEYGERRQVSGSMVYLCKYINERDNEGAVGC